MVVSRTPITLAITLSSPGNAAPTSMLKPATNQTML
jgi:hypothetical protein